ncbi:hypothetical protein GOV03_05160 [Candidatus Woesearchaeota archaeon]|nr:hypothetical protein [Candidatus Woesearchaeota archaeon]
MKKIEVLLVIMLFINMPLMSAETEDITSPVIEVELPDKIAGDELTFDGLTELGAKVKIYVNEMLRGVATTEEGEDSKGKFSFTGVSLLENEWNDISLEAEDEAGNVGSWSGRVFADADKPEITIEDIPEVIDGNEVSLKGTVSEICEIEILVNDASLFKETGQSFDKKIMLQEGKNTIKVIAKDEAGWETVKVLEVGSDTMPPQVKFELASGGEYYQGRAETDISGETEAGAKVYLYVYRRLGYEYQPNFEKAWAKATADEEGKFKFKEVNFECLTCGLEDLAPREIPSDLIDVSVIPSEVMEEAQRWTYYVYVVAEDQTGKIGSAQKPVSVNTCYSANWAFDVQSIAKFQAPLRLDPGLLDEGREVISAWFNVSYHGDGFPKLDSATGREIESAFKITNVRFEKACTPGMEKDETYAMGCKILPRVPRNLPNMDKTSHFVTWNLRKADELSEREDDFWNDFKERMLLFPLKINVDYRERSADGQWSETKTQTTCYDMGYFTDIPLDSKEMLPDWLVEEGTAGIEWTTDKIDAVMPYLEKAILVSGIGCITGFLGKMVTRYVRIVTSKLEAYFSKAEDKDEDEECPVNQNGLYLDSTIKGWEELAKRGELSPESITPKEYASKKLSEKCPETASLWEWEGYLDQLYRWSCDRVFCRKVPAAWTAEKKEEEIKAVILKQQQCSVTSSGIPLIEVENCQTIIEKQTVAVIGKSHVAVQYAKSNPSYFCYRTTDGDLYIRDDSYTSQDFKDKGIIKLYLMGNIGTKLSASVKSDLLVYKPAESDRFIVGKDASCEAVCKDPKKPGYKSDGCYTETRDSQGNILLENGGSPLVDNSFSAGYTNDCFIKEKTGELQQCVCKGDEETTKRYINEGENGMLRTAAREVDGIAEPWSYRQATIFRETKQAVGTYYSPLRYYSGRDLSGAFGADYLLDYLGEPKVQAINPNTQHIGAFQSVCLSGIRARLLMLNNILEGLKNCLYEAKYTGLHDAGVCKTLFSQHVCGLMYKAIAYLFTGCSPLSWDDVGGEEEFSDIGAIARAGFGSIPEAMQSSVDEIQDDYGNAKLNEFFATGVQGFAQSMCMAAFGFDWPMGFDFIMDAAYAVPMKTSVLVVPAERELATYNPKLGTAIYNYNIGAVVLPGCKIRSYRTYLKCVGPEDAGRPGVQCGPQGCDCINTASVSGVERTQPLDGGIGYEIKQGTPLSMKIPAPQKIDSQYRYDHVVVELQLDKFEEAGACFDEGYNDGKFYFPITDVSAPVNVACQVDITTGRYFCPELTDFFGKAGLAYLEEPYVTCWNERTERWTDCGTSNIFMLGDRIKVRAHTVTDGKGQCLKGTIGGLQQELPARPIPEGVVGPLSIEYSLGTVTEEMLSGVSSTLRKDYSKSNNGCQELVPIETTSGIINVGKEFEFNYEREGDNKYSLRIPIGVEVIGPAEYSVSDGFLKKGESKSFTLLEINSVIFKLDGFKVRNVLGNVNLEYPKRCVYKMGTSGAALGTNFRDLSVRFDLMYQDETGGCYYTNADQLVKTAVGKNSHTQKIRIQRESVVAEEASGMHEAFVKYDYDYVAVTANNLINRRAGDLMDAIAIYYYVAVDVMKEDKGQISSAGLKTHAGQLLKLFFDRKDANGNKIDDYPDTVEKEKDYQKINCYLCKVAEGLAITETITEYADKCKIC